MVLLSSLSAGSDESNAKKRVLIAEDDDAGLRHLVGADAELIMSVRTAGDFEHFEQTMRSALDWWT